MKMLNELNRAFIRNADYCKKRTGNYKEEPRKIIKLICRDQSWTKGSEEQKK